MSDETAEIAEYERRLSYAVERLARGMDQLVATRTELQNELSEALERIATLETEAAQASTASAVDPDTPQIDLAEVQALVTAHQALQAELEQLRAQLATEQDEKAVLEQGLADLKAQQDAALLALEKRLGQRARAATLMQADIGHLKQANDALIEANQLMMNTRGPASTQLVDALTRAELDALRAARAAETRELDEILSGLEPLLSRMNSAEEDADPNHQEAQTNG
ncbi:hypothetical protein BFP70_03035 [Thioclava sp. SK-1]|uniref:hypothetical protein n=1 Tax=Thioclava sp. SK-1 TaxID=1889770 RepID=UPI0008243D83|nr:hypothetical protein [Thioclava sp. SK-1]OCX67150.1 hypothetical protein BFP70_03035 [Thioclava sp. SK-1]